MKKIIIVGGGSAGITVAARLLKARAHLEVVVIEPSKYHYYQPLWTLAGAGIVDKEVTRRSTIDVMPKGAILISMSVKSFTPSENTLTLENDEVLVYDYLVVCPGIQVNWHLVEGLSETLGQNGVCSNYSYESVESTWQTLQNLKEGNALFTFPNTAVKCGGAPQKIMYLADDYLRRVGLREKINIEFHTAGSRIFGIPKYRKSLERILETRDLHLCPHHNLEKVDGPNRIAYFRNVESNELVERPFSMLHVTPPMSAPDFVKNSELANSEGWVDVDKFTLQHKRFANVFSLGDASSLPTSKTGAAVRKEAPVLVANLLSHLKGTELVARYNGYTSCPIITGRGKLILAEFDYEGKPVESFPFDQSKERLSMYLLKRYALPLIYWYGMLKGRM